MSVAPRHQRLGLNHIAFYRGWMEGTIELGQLANRYLETGDDLRAARRTLKAIEQSLIAACRRIGKPSDARLIRLNSVKLRDAAQTQISPPAQASVPSFEQYQAQVDPDGFWSISDLYEQYEETYGGTESEPSNTREQRRKERALRLIQRRNALINDLERVLAESPKLEHDVRGWLDESLSNRLVAARLVTIADVIAHANRVGFHWYRSVPGLGRGKAQRIVEFLQRHKESIGETLTPFALTPPSKITNEMLAHEGYAPTLPVTTEPQLAFGPVQDGLYVPPDQLDGSQGMNRAAAHTNRSGANNDWEAIQRWLNTFNTPDKRNTQRNYRKEAERLLLWAVIERGIPFSSMTTDDVVAFRDFLADPKPYERWTCERSYKRSDPRWRPFIWRLPPKSKRPLPGDPGYRDMQKQVGLSEESIQQAMSVCRALCAWLVEQRYLDYNPFLRFSKRKGDIVVNTRRSFSRRQWAHIMRALEKMDATDIRTIRLRFILRLAYATGLRLSELVNATTGDITLEEDLGDDISEAYFLSVLGKGNVRRSVPLPRSVRQCLSEYLIARNLGPNPMACEKDTPLIAKLYPVQGSFRMTPAGLYEVLRSFFEHVATQIPNDGTSNDARHFYQASTHWLRHTYGTHALSYGADINIVKENMGHKSLTTTSLYVRPEKRLQLEQMEAFDRAAFKQDSVTTDSTQS